MKLLKFVTAVLNDENGISEEAFSALYELAEDNVEIRDLLSKVDATDGRFYLPAND